MSIDMMVDSDQLDFDETSRVHSRTSRLTKILMALLFIGLLGWFAIILFSPDTLPIEQVRIEGDFTRLSPVDLQLLLTDRVRGGFFNLDVDAVRMTLLDEPWVNQVTVKRIWPNALKVIVVEQTPVARWREGLLNVAGEYFVPEPDTIPVQLPLLSGPIGSEIQLLGHFEKILPPLRAIGFNIASITLDERRAWSFMLTNGINVILGRHDFEERFNRFLTLIPTTLSGRTEQAESIDMRYTNGISIKWKQ